MLPGSIVPLSIPRVSSRRATGGRRPWHGPLLAACCLLSSLSVSAQSSQYTAPGGASAAAPPTAESIEAQMEAARWHLGPLRLAPWLGLRGLTWEQNVFVENQGETSDLTGSVGAGLTAYLPTGAKVFWIVQAMPEYIWWLDLSERNELVGRYGGGVVADLNRLRLAANWHRTEQQQVVTIESPQQVVAERQGVTASGELSLGASLVFAAGFSDEETTNRLPGDAVGRLDFSRADRSEQTVTRGAALPALRRPRPRRRRRGDGHRVPVRRPRPVVHRHLPLRLPPSRGQPPRAGRAHRAAQPRSEGRLGPAAGGRDRRPGAPRDHPGLALPLRRLRQPFSITYALDTAYSHLIDQRLGIDVGAPFGERLAMRAFFESGSADFESLGAAPPRSDDISAYGAEATYELGEWLSYRAGLHQVTIDSNLPGLDRDYLRVTSSFILSTGDWVWH